MSGKYLIIFVMIVALMPVAESLTHDFRAFSGLAEFSACQCSFTSDKIVVQNTGDLSLTFKVTKTGTAASFITIYPDTFSLPAGKAVELKSYINVPCTALPGEYDLDIYFSTNMATRKMLKQKITVERCPNLEIVPINYTKSVKPCEKASYRIDIRNTGPYPEIYDFAISPLTEHISTSFNAVQINPNGTAPLFIEVNAPCEISGDFNLTLTTKTRQSGFIAETPFYLHILPYYNYTISVDEDITVCEDSGLIMPVRVRNLADFSNTFNLTYSGSAWAPKPMGFEVSAGSSKRKNATMDIPKGSEGEYHLLIDAISGKGQAGLEENVTITVERCYGTEISFEELSRTICVGEEGGTKYKIKNTGTQEQELVINVTAPEGFTTQGELTLPAGEEKELMLNMVPLDWQAGKNYRIKVRVTNKDHPDYWAEASIPVTVVGSWQCELLVLEPKSKRIHPEPTTFTLKAKNRGVQQGTYKISYLGPDWVSLNIDEFVIDSRMESYIDVIANPPNITGTFPINMTFKVVGKDTAYNIPFNLKVARPNPIALMLAGFWSTYWLFIVLGLILLIIIIILLIILAYNSKKKQALKSAEERNEESAQKALELAEGQERRRKYYNALVAYEEVSTRYRRTRSAKEARKRMTVLNRMLKEEAKPQPVRAQQPARAEKKRPKKEEEPSLAFNIILTAIILILLIVAFVALYHTTFKPAGNETVNDTFTQVPDSGKTRWVWEQDTTYTVDLSDMFADPDMDALKFTFTEPDHIEVEKVESTIMLTPEEGWSGEDTIVFTADDLKGGKVKSPEIELIVVPAVMNEAEEQSSLGRFWGWIGAYVNYIILGLVILIILIGLIRILEKEKK